MEYRVEEAAEALFLDPEDLLDVFEPFFEETEEILEEIEISLDTEDRQAIKKLLHTLKGSASNLRMDYISNLALELEKEAIAGNLSAILERLPELRREVDRVQDAVDRYFEE